MLEKVLVWGDKRDCAAFVYFGVKVQDRQIKNQRPCNHPYL